MVEITENINKNPKLLDKWNKIKNKIVKKGKKRYNYNIGKLINNHYRNIISDIHQHNREIFDSFFDSCDEIKNINFSDKIVLVKDLTSIISNIKNIRYEVGNVDIFGVLDILVDLLYHVKEKILYIIDKNKIIDFIL